MIECLIQRGSTTLEGLYRYCKLSKSDINEQDISLSVSFLYLLNKVKYLVDGDTVTLVDSKDA